ncbi:MAG TPA: lipoprotein [Nevskiaceae bacterium]|nr:lipoprotein [Nevskiaceae bacterium]
MKFVLSFVVLLLCACGQAGALYLPGQSPQQGKREQQAAPTAPPQATPATSSGSSP